MSEQKHDIDQWAREKIEQSTFDFNEAYWDEMAQLLDQQETRKRGFLWWWISGGSAALLLGFGLWRMGELNSIPVQLAQEVSNQQTIQKAEKGTHTLHAPDDELVSDLPVDKDVNSSTMPTTRSVSSMHNVPRIESSDFNQPAANYIMNVSDARSSEAIEANSEVDRANNEWISMATPAIEIESFGIESQDAVEIVFNSKKVKPLRTFVQIGGQIGFAGSEMVRGGNGALGIHFNLEHGRKYLRTGLEMNVQGVSGAAYYEERQVFSFSSMVAFNEVKYKQTTNMAIPVYVGYSGLKHSFGLGFKANFLLNARSQVKEWDQPTARYDWGYSPGLREFWLSGGVEYNCMITKRWSISAQMECDFTSRFYPSMQGTPSRLFAGSLGFKYRLNN
jgi:hypothetical protein